MWIIIRENGLMYGDKFLSWIEILGKFDQKKGWINWIENRDQKWVE